MKYKSYPKYKFVKAGFFDQIPEKWNMGKLKNLVKLAYGDSLKSEIRENGEFDVYGSNGVVGSHSECNTKSPCLIVGRKGSFGKVNFSEKPVFAIDTTYFIDKRYTNHDIKWLYYLLVSLKLDSFSKDSAVPGLSREDAYFYDVPICSFEEQLSIAAFLDRETARIDALIEKKKKLIELLKEKRTALITRAVTKGLNKEVKMKPSGIEWLGEIPEHWEVVPFLKYVESKVDYRGATPQKHDDGVFLVTAKNIKDGFIDYECSKEYVSIEEYDSIMHRGLPQINDLLFTTEAPLGNIALIDRTDVALAQRVIKFRMKSKSFLQIFTKFSMMSGYFQHQLKSLATGSTAEGIKSSKLSLLRIIKPTIIEQENIIVFINSAEAKISKLVCSLELAISKLQEYRTALISAAVTGKIRVGEVVK